VKAAACYMKRAFGKRGLSS